MNKLGGLFLNGLDYFGMAVAGGVYGDPGCEIQKTVAIYIPTISPLGANHDFG